MSSDGRSKATPVQGINPRQYLDLITSLDEFFGLHLPHTYHPTSPGRPVPAATMLALPSEQTDLEKVAIGFPHISKKAKAEVQLCIHGKAVHHFPFKSIIISPSMLLID